MLELFTTGTKEGAKLKDRFELCGASPISWFFAVFVESVFSTLLLPFRSYRGCGVTPSRLDLEVTDPRGFLVAAASTDALEGRIGDRDLGLIVLGRFGDVVLLLLRTHVAGLGWKRTSRYV